MPSNVVKVWLRLETGVCTHEGTSELVQRGGANFFLLCYVTSRPTLKQEQALGLSPQKLLATWFTSHLLRPSLGRGGNQAFPQDQFTTLIGF